MIKLKICSTEGCFHKLYDVCQKNMDLIQFRGNFKRNFGSTFACYECIVDQMENISADDLMLNDKIDSDKTDSDKTDSDCGSEKDIDSVSGSKRKMILKKMNVGKIKQILLNYNLMLIIKKMNVAKIK